MSIFSWVMAKIYDKTMQDAEAKCLGEWRSVLLGDLSGTVVEIGSGTGLNLEYYPNGIDQLILVEPDANMRTILSQKLAFKSSVSAKIIECAAESIPLPNESVDAVVSTLVLCSVNNQSQVLSEINRILRPKGKLIFIEHVAADKNLSRYKWQRWLEPIWKTIACGCRLTQQTESSIINAGFEFEEISRQSIRGVPPIVRPSIKGIAIKGEWV